tara:strand:+ start:22476 stop:23228 length:753 start_codon:yes stop_codon:yes gene_type:complete
MYKASIIIPYFRKKLFIKETINSILRQTYKNFEVIFIYDDEDKSDLYFIKKLIKKDKRFKFIINKKNLGAGESRNKGIKNAKGKYICFIDADDIWNKNKLELQINFMRKKNISFSHSTYKIIDKDNKVKGIRIAENYDNFLKLSKSCNIGLSSVIFEKKILKSKLKFPKIKTKEDFVLWLRILKNGTKIYAFKKNLVKWRRSKNSLSSSSFQKIKDGFKVYNYYLNYNFIKSFYYLFILSFNYFKKSVFN